MQPGIYRMTFYSLAVLCAVLSIIFCIAGEINRAGWSMCFFFVSIAFALRGNLLLQDMSVELNVEGLKKYAVPNVPFFE